MPYIEDDKSISFGIINNIVNCNFNYNKCLAYIVDIYKNNYKNHVYTTIINIKTKKSIYIIFIYIIILLMKN